MVFGCHVHIGIADREAAIQTMNRVRPWLATILALGANSPFWLGEDTGYASYRSNVCGRWPTAGTPSTFASRAEYDKLIRVLEDTGSIRDESKIYWDVRPSARFETLEFRVTDVCLRVDEAVMIAGLARALARTCHDDAARDAPMTSVSPELLRAAKWRAARFGLEDSLIDIENGRPVAAPELVRRLLDFVRPSLEDDGDWDEVSTAVEETFAAGTGACRQRDAYRRAGRLEEVVDLIVEETSTGVTGGARR